MSLCFYYFNEHSLFALIPLSKTFQHLKVPASEPIPDCCFFFSIDQGRWDCKGALVKDSFVPTEENARKIETWNQTSGHEPQTCRKGFFKLGMCAVNCYTQWFSGLSCPEFDVPPRQQYKVAKSRVFKYNFVVVIEKLRDPEYVRAVEEFFGVEGLTRRSSAFCERESHKANEKVPLVIRNETIHRLTKLNELDIKLYHELSDCLAGGRYDFPKWDPDHFALHTFNHTAAKEALKMRKQAKMKRKNTE